MITIYPTSPLSAHRSNAPILPPQPHVPLDAVELAVPDDVLPVHVLSDVSLVDAVSLVDELSHEDEDGE